jgi:hypothetical protein
MSQQHNEDQLIKRFPRLELSYETAAHKKVSTNYDICIAIPVGKKSFMWFTYEGAADVCYLLETNKDQKITKISKTPAENIPQELAHGTVLYGSLLENQVFVVEDIYYFCGLPMKQLTFGEKLTYFYQLMTKYTIKQIRIVLPYMCSVTGDNKLLDSLQFYESMTSSTAYTTHHVQFRSSHTISPYLNHVYKKRQDFVATMSNDASETMLLFPRTDLDHYAQMSLKSAVFRVKADIQNDIYHLFAADGYYTNIAYIENRQSSTYMNSLFRNIRENINIDYGEESEDEDVFQNTSLDKYVDLNKEYKMNCIYNVKFRKWMPVSVASEATPLVQLAALIQSNRPQRSFQGHYNQGPPKKPFHVQRHQNSYKTQQKPCYKAYTKNR